ncbi:ACT domain-containing protein [Methanohalophilus levihalophilus]|uniref:ACT domain-containing protein n=1 Tax=Methanohalophilus levihalophilus TaxID=1431282 RepID=UPI001AE82732|nr:ACT domain-containing protein [Methanohalophilus levihalophilus]MBP2029582.1 ACT domain-containing protein [Methanohalophilus levihalophilus]
MASTRFIITVIGIDKVGIVAKVTGIMAEHSVNIVDISQTIMEDLFTMIMLAEAREENFDLKGFQTAMQKTGEELGVDIRVQNEDAFRFMHRI